MTIGLGIATQSVMEVKTARQETESSDAFNAAEKGIERALQGGYDAPFTESNNTITVNTNTVTDQYSSTILRGKSVQLNMEGVNSLTLTWTDGGNCQSAIVVTFITASYTLSRQAYGNSCGGFINATCSGTTCTTTIPTSGISLARIKAVFGDTNLTASLTGAALPQQTVYTSTAQNISGETRAVEVTQAEPAVSSIFDYALFAGGGSL